MREWLTGSTSSTVSWAAAMGGVRPVTPASRLASPCKKCGLDMNTCAKRAAKLEVENAHRATAAGVNVGDFGGTMRMGARALVRPGNAPDRGTRTR
jgi:hypothetical protein